MKMKKLISGLTALIMSVAAMQSIAFADVSIGTFDSGLRNSRLRMGEKVAAGTQQNLIDVSNIDGKAGIRGTNVATLIKDFETLYEGKIALEMAFVIDEIEGEVNAEANANQPIQIFLQDYDESTGEVYDTATMMWTNYVLASKLNNKKYGEDWGSTYNQVLPTYINGKPHFCTKVVFDLEAKTAASYLKWDDGTDEWHLIQSGMTFTEDLFPRINRLKISLASWYAKGIEIDYVKIYNEDDSTIHINDTFDNGENFFDAGYDVDFNGQYGYVKNGAAYVKNPNTGADASSFNVSYPFDKAYSEGTVVVEADMTPFKADGTAVYNDGGVLGIALYDTSGSSIVRMSCGNNTAESYVYLNEASLYGVSPVYIGGGEWDGKTLWNETGATLGQYRFVIDYETGNLDIYKATVAGNYIKRNTVELNVKKSDGTIPAVAGVCFMSWSNAAMTDTVAFDNVNVYTIASDKETSELVAFDENQNAVTTASSGDKLTFAAGGAVWEGDVGMTIIAALKDSSGKLKDVEFYEDFIPLVSEDTSYLLNKMQYTVPESAVAGDVIELMLWDGITTVKPYVAASAISVK